MAGAGLVGWLPPAPCGVVVDYVHVLSAVSNEAIPCKASPVNNGRQRAEGAGEMEMNADGTRTVNNSREIGLAVEEQRNLPVPGLSAHLDCLPGASERWRVGQVEVADGLDGHLVEDGGCGDVDAFGDLGMLVAE